MHEQEQLRLAEQVRQACIQAALEGYEMATLSGLCHEGAWEMAVDAMRSLNLQRLLQSGRADQNSSR
ncbi:hypothetical protein RY27_04080 [Litorilinea aerophila]|nr:hypothetical protein RY27_04080 [Litorilinea aerophila]